MGQAVRKLKPPSEPAIPKPKRQSVDIRPRPPEPQIIIEPDQSIAGVENRPDPNFASMSQQLVGMITTRSAGQKEHPTATSKEDYTRPMPTDRHTTLRSGPDENSIQSPGTLNHAHIRELFILYHGRADGQEKPLDVESLATKFSVDVELLKRVLQHTSLVYNQKAVGSTTAQVADMAQQVNDTSQQLKGPEGLQMKRQPT